MKVLAITTLYIVLVTGVASAQDSACVNAEPPVGVTTCTDGVCCYCTPGVDNKGNEYPRGFAPMDCSTLNAAGVVLHTETELEPQTRVCTDDLGLNWQQVVTHVCTNYVGEGLPITAPRNFPGASPGAPLLVE